MSLYFPTGFQTKIVNNKNSYTSCKAERMAFQQRKISLIVCDIS